MHTLVDSEKLCLYEHPSQFNRFGDNQSIFCLYRVIRSYNARLLLLFTVQVSHLGYRWR